MIREARMGQLGFFDADKRLAALSAKGDPVGSKNEAVGRGGSFRQSHINGNDGTAGIGHRPIGCCELHSQEQAQLKIRPFEQQPTDCQNLPSSLCK
jgi:hypothetical protein